MGTFTIVSTNMHAYVDQLGKYIIKRRGQFEQWPGSLESSTFADGLPLHRIEALVNHPEEASLDANYFSEREFSHMWALWQDYERKKVPSTIPTQSNWLTAGYEWMRRRLD